MSTRETIEGYMKAWTAKDFDATRALLADDIDFQGSMEKHATADGFMGGLKMFVNGMYADHTLVEQLWGDDSAFLLYDCTLKNGGTMRCSEFLQVADGKITKIRLTFDTYPMRKDRPKS